MNLGDRKSEGLEIGYKLAMVAMDRRGQNLENVKINVPLTQTPGHFGEQILRENIQELYEKKIRETKMRGRNSREGKEWE